MRLRLKVSLSTFYGPRGQTLSVYPPGLGEGRGLWCWGRCLWGLRDIGLEGLWKFPNPWGWKWNKWPKGDLISWGSSSMNIGKWSSGSEKKEEWNGLEPNEVNPNPGPVENINEEWPLLSAQKKTIACVHIHLNRFHFFLAYVCKFYWDLNMLVYYCSLFGISSKI